MYAVRIILKRLITVNNTLKKYKVPRGTRRTLLFYLVKLFGLFSKSRINFNFQYEIAIKRYQQQHVFVETCHSYLQVFYYINRADGENCSQ